MNFLNKTNRSLFVLAAVAVALCSGTLFAQKVYHETNGILTIECESTESPLGKWVRVTKPAGFTGECGLEFMGNTASGGTANSPLEYKFKITNGGIYKHAIRCHKRLEGAAGDLCNDCWWKITGNYTAGGTAPLSFLQGYGKLYAYGLSVSTWDFQNPFDHPGGTVFYNFKAGETYTLTIAGRSQRYNMDRLVLFLTSTTDAAKFSADSLKACDPKNPESPTSPVGTIKTTQAHYLVPALGNSAEVYSLTGKYFGRFPISATGKVLTEGKIGTASYITVMPGNFSQKKLITER